MLSVEDNELITNTDRGTPMGELFRRYWLPACLSEELPGADCNPIRVKMLGEDLVAFRDSDGNPGVIDAYCPHRGAPMFFGRNEESGIRCLYHGWKFDVTGQCVEMPNIPHGETAKNRMRTIAYPAVEAANMIWIYMGPEDRKPPMPEFPYIAEVAKENVYVTRYEINCNYLQAMEGDYDPSHGGFVHSTLGQNLDVAAQATGRPTNQYQLMKPQRPLSRIVAVEDTPIGVMYAGTRQVSETEEVVMASHVIMPCFPNAGLSAAGVFSTNIRVPIDNENENHYRLRWTRRGFTEKELYDFKYGGYVFPLHEAGTYLSKQRKENDYGFDAVLQRQFNYSGVVPFPTQDLMMIEHQWGAIAQREKEHLVAADREIIGIRRRLLKMAKNLADGIEPEEPFRMKSIRQENADNFLTIPRASRLDVDAMDKLASGLNTTRTGKQGTEDEVMWTASVEVDPTLAKDTTIG